MVGGRSVLQKILILWNLQHVHSILSYPKMNFFRRRWMNIEGWNKWLRIKKEEKKRSHLQPLLNILGTISILANNFSEQYSSAPCPPYMVSYVHFSIKIFGAMYISMSDIGENEMPEEKLNEVNHKIRRVFGYVGALASILLAFSYAKQLLNI